MAVTLSPDYFNRVSGGYMQAHLGVIVTEVSEGLLRAELAVTPFLLAPNGFMHGGTVVALADTCAGYACIAHLPAGAPSLTTTQPKTNYFGTPRPRLGRGVATRRP